MSAMLGGVAKLLESISRKKLAAPKESGANERHARQILHPSGLSMPELNPRRIRVVVFRDEKGMKQPVFDSQQINISEGEEPCTRSLCDMRCVESSLSLSSNGINPSCHSAGWSSQSTGTTRRGFFVKRPSTDSELLGEMMFGSMPMKVVGDTIKIHYTRSTDQLMLSKVFTCQKRPMAQCSLVDFSESCPLPNCSPSSGGGGGGGGGGKRSERSFSYGRKTRHLSPDVSRLPSSTLSVPIQQPPPINSLSVSPHHLSVPSSHSPPSPLSSCCTTPSLSSSFTRRIQRSRSTSLENASEVYRKVLRPMDQHSNINTRKRRKYAIGFIICLNELSKTDIRHFQSFIFSHFTLIDAHLEKLRLGVEEASNGKSIVMVETITKAYENFLRDFLSLYRTPRIESPVWLSLVCRVDKRKELCLQFMEEFASAIVEMDTKETKFFLSSLLTAVLSHHLAWIFTVSYQQQQQQSLDNGRHGKHSSSKSLGVLAECHPYNPLWAQLGDLLGSVTNPLKLSRTIVVGQSSFTVARLLYILTYFIRCSEVEPGFPEMGLSPPPTIPIATTQDNRTQEVKIPPSSSSSSSSSYMGADNSSYDPSHEVFEGSRASSEVFGGSRASSITIMSEHDALSPFSSPVNHGSDTSIIRTHPFGIKATNAISQIHSSSEARKGSHSESDSLNGFNIRGGGGGGGVEPAVRPGRKSSSLNRSGDLSTSQASLKKHSPLLSFSRDHLEREGHMISTEGQVTSGDGHVTMTCDDLDERREHLAAMKTERNCNCHYGNPNTCATIASCESMGLCPIKKDFLTFDPDRKHASNHSNGTQARHLSYSARATIDNSDFSSISHLATRGLLGPSPHSPDSALSSVIPSHTSCSSLDSGYDHSWSLTTNSSREDSCPDCPEFPGSLLTMTGINRNINVPMYPPYAVSGQGRVCQGSGGTNYVQRGMVANSNDTTTVNFPPSEGQLELDACSPPPPLPPSQNGDFSDPLKPLPVRKLANHKKSLIHQNADMGHISPSLPPRGEGVDGASNGQQQGPLCLGINSVVAVSTNQISDKISTNSSSSSSDLILHHSLPSQYFNYDSLNPLNGFSTTTSSSSSLSPTYVESEVDSGHGTKSSVGDREYDSLSQISTSYENQELLPPESKPHTLDPTSELRKKQTLHPSSTASPLIGQYRDEEAGAVSTTKCRLCDACDSYCCRDHTPVSKIDTEGEGLPNHAPSSSVLRQQLDAHDRSMSMGMRPLTLERFDNFTDVPFPDMEDYHLDMHTPGRASCDVHYQQISDFGHSLFVGVSPRYLPDFVLHGTTERADQAFQDKVIKDISHSVKHSIVDEPVDHGVGIVADTDSWTVKVLAASKSPQTSDVVYSSATLHPARSIRQMLSSVKNMHAMRMPSEFCLSYVEDSLKALNEQSVMLADALVEIGEDVELTEVLPKVAESLSIDPSDCTMLLALAAVNCCDPDMTYRLNYQHMQYAMGRKFI